MTFFLVLLCLVLIICTAFTFFYFDSKAREIRKQYRLLSNQYNSLKSKVSPNIESFKKLKIKYVNPSFSSGITKQNVFVYLTPIDKSKSVAKIIEVCDIPIFEECVIANEIWLYVHLDSDNNINSRGWIHKRDFSFLKDKIQII